MLKLKEIYARTDYRTGERFDEYMAKRRITEADIIAACASLASVDVRDHLGNKVSFALGSSAIPDIKHTP